MQVVLVRTMCFHHLGGFFHRQCRFETSQRLPTCILCSMWHNCCISQRSSNVIQARFSSLGVADLGVPLCLVQDQSLTPETTSNSDPAVVGFKKLCGLVVLCRQDREYALIRLPLVGTFYRTSFLLLLVKAS